MGLGRVFNSDLGLQLSPGFTQQVNLSSAVSVQWLSSTGALVFGISGTGAITSSIGVLSSFTMDTAANTFKIAGYPVVVTAPTSTQVLTFNGTQWIAASVSSGVGNTWISTTDASGSFVDQSTSNIGAIGFVSTAATNPSATGGLFTIQSANSLLTGNFLSVWNSGGTQLSAITSNGAYSVGTGSTKTIYGAASITVNGFALTLPSTLADTVVLLTAGQTLTNKTLTSPTLGGTTSNGGTISGGTISGAAISGGSIAGTITGGATLSGNSTFSGTITLTTLAGTIAGTPTFSGNLTFSGTPSFSAITVSGQLTNTDYASNAIRTQGNYQAWYNSAPSNPTPILNVWNTVITAIGTDASGRVQIGSGFAGASTTNNILDDGSGNMSIGSGSGNVTLTVKQGGSPNPFIVNCKVPGGGFQINDASNSNACAMALSTSTYITAAGYDLNCAVFSVTSDSRLKPDFTAYGSDPLVELDAVRFGQYRHMGGVDLGSWRAGIAAETLPDSVHGRASDGYYSIQHPDSFAWSVGVMKAMARRIEELEAKLAS